MELQNEDEKNEKQPTPLKPHQYPFGILIAGLIVLLLSVYAFMLSPKYCKALKYLHEAEKSYEMGKYNHSKKYSKIALEIVPSSKKCKINLSKTYFAINKPIKAINLIRCMGLNNYVWNDFCEVMPKEYQAMFETKKARRSA